MKKVFLDTNILMDFIENREKREYANMGYIYRKRNQEERYNLIRKARRIATVLPCDTDQLDSALNIPVKDYEDMLQYQCALASGCDVIVTNNKRDFQEFCQLPFLTSEEFLLQVDY